MVRLTEHHPHKCSRDVCFTMRLCVPPGMPAVDVTC